MNATKEGVQYDAGSVQEKISKTGQLPFGVGYSLFSFLYHSFLMYFPPLYSYYSCFSLFIIDTKLEGVAKIICRCLKKTPKKRPSAETLKNEFLQMSVMY